MHAGSTFFHGSHFFEEFCFQLFCRPFGWVTIALLCFINLSSKAYIVHINHSGLQSHLNLYRAPNSIRLDGRCVQLLYKPLLDCKTIPHQNTKWSLLREWVSVTLFHLSTKLRSSLSPICTSLLVSFDRSFVNHRDMRSQMNLDTRHKRRNWWQTLKILIILVTRRMSKQCRWITYPGN